MLITLSFSVSVLTAIFQVNLGNPVFSEAKDDGGGGDNWTTGAISRAKLQSNHHHQQTNTHCANKMLACLLAVSCLAVRCRHSNTLLVLLHLYIAYLLFFIRQRALVSPFRHTRRLGPVAPPCHGHTARPGDWSMFSLSSMVAPPPATRDDDVITRHGHVTVAWFLVSDIRLSGANRGRAPCTVYEPLPAIYCSATD